jgi:threonylcarbamoyladenosine tRNA methylthiotransferase MtaB
MERKYSPEAFADMVRLCREEIPGVTITTDVMVGFPGETDEEFDEGHHFIRDIAFDGMHVFKYSKRSGTRAGRMSDQVPEEVKAARSEVLRDEAALGVRRLLARHDGVTALVAWENEREGIWRGLTDTNVRVFGTPDPGSTGRLQRVRLGGPFRDGLWAEPVTVELTLTPVAGTHGAR